MIDLLKISAERSRENAPMREIDEQLLGYLAKTLDHETKLEVENALIDQSELRASFKHLRTALQPLEWDRDTIEPPLDLVERTLATVAQHIVEEHGCAPGDHPTPVADYLRETSSDGSLLPSTYYPFSASEAVGTSFSRRNVAAFVGLALLLMALAIPAILLVRDRSNLLACQQRLATLHQSLMSYADTFDHRLPQINENETGYSFVGKLQRSGLIPETMTLLCPSRPANTAQKTPLDYAYTFGYRDLDGHLVGLRRDVDDGHTPLLADAPAGTQSRCLGDPTPINHAKGQNVLFMNGSIRFCTHAVLNRDDHLYCNQNQQIKAGVNRFDSMLGRGDETP
jgi:hypothetical protein